jgi:hypothetical protein
MPLKDVHFVNGFCNSLPKTLHLQQRFYSLMNRAFSGLGSPTFAMNMCGPMKILTQFGLIISNDSFPSTCGLEF